MSADVLGLSAAFLVAVLVYGTPSDASDQVRPLLELAVFALTLPVWVVLGMLYGLYDQDEERTEHSTVDEFTGVLQPRHGRQLAGVHHGVADRGRRSRRRADDPVLGAGDRAGRRRAGRSPARPAAAASSYVQNTVILGAGDVGQLIARKLIQHPEYGINLVGMMDDDPKERRGELENVPLLGPPSSLPNIIRTFDVERVIIAFSNDSHGDTLELVHSLREFDVQLDLVPRLFEIVGPRVGVHTVEGLPLVGLPPTRIRRSSRMLKRAIDIVGATLGLIATAPLFAFIALPRPARLARADLLPPGAPRHRHAAVHGPEVPHDARRDRRQRPPRLHQGDDDRGRRRPRAHGIYKLDRARRDHRRRAAGCARRASTSCRS